MKSTLFAIGAVLALGVAPAVAQQAQVFDHAAQLQAYSTDLPRDSAKRCFDGRFIAGVNRSGDKTVFVQGTNGGIYRLQMAEGCDALNAAQKLSVRTSGSDLVCTGDSAEVIAQTSAGARHCAITDVQRLTSKEVSSLSTATRR
jgi:hypothetical protein